MVIGASTAGLFSAYLLAKGGIPVCVYDQAEELGPPARTLILTSRIIDVLGEVLSQAIVNRTQTVQLFSPQRSIHIRLNEPDLIVERQALVRLLAEKARAAGAEIHLGYRFLGLEPARHGLVLNLEGPQGERIEPIRTQALIGADGVNSQVAKAAGCRSRVTISLLQARVAMPPWARADTTQVWFDPQSTRYFYWLVPESDEHAVVGLIAEDQRQARESLDHFLVARDLEPLSYQGAQVPFSMGESPLCKGGDESHILLVGDAASQVKVTTVGGVVTGLCGAQAAARAILQGSDYRRELAGLHRELGLHLLVRRILNHFTAADYDRLLALVNHRTRGVLAAHNRDEVVKVLGSSVLAQPRLLWLAAQPLLRSVTPLRKPKGERTSQARRRVSVR